MVATPQERGFAAQLRRLETQLAALTNKAPNALIVPGTQGDLVSIGASGYVDATGAPINTLTISDPVTGRVIMRQVPTTTTPRSDGTIQGSAWEWQLNDAAGSAGIASDGRAGVGLSRPFAHIPLVKRWAPPLQTATSTGAATAAAANVVGMGALWQGRISLCSHPCVSVDGTWGDMDSSLPTITYQLRVGVEAFTWTANGQAAGLHRFDVSSLVGQQDIDVTLSVTSVGTAAGTDRIVIDQLGCSLREWPPGAVFG